MRKRGSGLISVFAVTAAVAVICLVSAGCVRTVDRHPTSAPQTPAVPTTPVVFGSGPDAGTFVPDPSASPQATGDGEIGADTAIHRFLTSSHFTADGAEPDDAIAMEGRLTIPLGGGTYTAENQVVYGYRWRSCPVRSHPKVVSADTPTPPVAVDPDCTQWIFLDAASGRLIRVTYTSGS